MTAILENSDSPATGCEPHPGHEAIIRAGLRSPSAHNAQAWRLRPLADGRSYELHYDHLDYLPLDPDDRDAYLGMGAFYETLALAADAAGMRGHFAPAFARTGSDLLLGTVTFVPAADAPRDPLSAAIAGRRTNRNSYTRGRPLPPELARQLEELGCAFVRPRSVLSLMIEASIRSWADRRFVGDLKTWMRIGDDEAPDGMTPRCLGLSGFDTTAFRFALWRGRLPWPLALVYSSRDIRLTLACSTLTVLGAASLDPEDLFDAGRRMLRVWTATCAAGWACHPMSIVIDRPETASRLGRVAGFEHPVAILRVGYADKELPPSNRKTLAQVMSR